MTKKYKHSCGLYAVFHSERCQTPGLEEYANVGKTRAIISQKNGHDVRSIVNLYVSTLTAGKDIVIIYLDNNTSNWVTVKNPTINWNTKYVSFEVPGSCTVQVLAK